MVFLICSGNFLGSEGKTECAVSFQHLLWREQSGCELAVSQIALYSKNSGFSVGGEWHSEIQA
jgi:hypothetical protein